MKVKLRAWSLVALAAALTGLGSLINSWFYVVGGSAILLYIAWRYTTFASVRSGLRMAVTRVPDKKVAHFGSFVSFEVTVTSNLTVRGTFSEVLPEYVALVDGQASKALTLGPGVHGTLRYTVQLTSRADLELERAQFTLDNDLFSETIDFQVGQTTLSQPSGAVTIEQGARGSSVGSGIQTSSVSNLFHGRQIGRGTDTAFLRPYQYFDSAKLIDWKASARSAELLVMVKELLPELEDSRFGKGTPVNLIVDQTGSMARGALGQTNLNLAVNFAGRFVKLGVKKGSPLSLVTYDEDSVTDLKLGDSPAHVTSIVDTLNSAEFESRRTHDTNVTLPSNWKPGITSAEVTRFRKSYAQAEDGITDDDVRRFREVVSYLYAHEEGYIDELERSTAFKAIATTLNRSARRSILIILSDFEDDLDPLTEGIRLAAGRGNAVYVVALFPNTSETFEDALVNIEDLYASYEKHRLRMNALRQIKGVTVHEVTLSDLLETEDSWLKTA